MITKWKVFNFKSISEETELDLGPLTIFAGANSSGKSTFIQSVWGISLSVPLLVEKWYGQHISCMARPHWFTMTTREYSVALKIHL